jgi:hypothetical protein
LTQTPPLPATPTWVTSVDELVQIFHDALAAVAPVLERARIHSDLPRAYDEWDAIAQALFHNVVVRSIQWSDEVHLDLADKGLFDLGQYATLGAVSAASPHLIVRNASNGEWHMFHAIVSRQRLFDSVQVLKPGEMTPTETPYETARFALRIPSRDEVIEKLTIQL